VNRLQQQLLRIVTFAQLHGSASDKLAAQEVRDGLLDAPQRDLREVAVIEECEVDGDVFLAKVRWIYNPVPVGGVLWWDHAGIAAAPAKPTVTRLAVEDDGAY
jgi:hypothetical protein